MGQTARRPRLPHVDLSVLGGSQLELVGITTLDRSSTYYAKNRDKYVAVAAVSVPWQCGRVGGSSECCSFFGPAEGSDFAKLFGCEY